MRAVIQAGLFALFLGEAFAQIQPDVAEILKKVTESYRDVSQYEVVTSVTFKDPTTKQITSRDMRFVFKAPDKYLEEVTGSDLAKETTPGDPIVDEVSTVYDGSRLWVYMPKLNKYRVYDAPNLPRDTAPEAADLYAGIGMYRHAAEIFDKARFIREESVVMQGSTRVCFVLAGGDQLASGAMLWIDKSNYHILRMGDQDGSADMVFKTVNLNASLPDDLFKFEPPTGARKLDKPGF